MRDQIVLVHRRGGVIVLSFLQRDEECIALCVHFAAVPFLDRVSQDFMMFRQRGGILFSELIEQTGRTLDIGKEKSDSA